MLPAGRILRWLSRIEFAVAGFVIATQTCRVHPPQYTEINVRAALRYNVLVSGRVGRVEGLGHSGRNPLSAGGRLARKRRIPQTSEIVGIRVRSAVDFRSVRRDFTAQVFSSELG